MRSAIYLIKAVTNMHVGSGDINIDIIDNKVQKDATTKLPVIHSSSLKGALREHFEEKWGAKDKKIAYIFGKEGDSDGAGHYSFFEATILTLPQRSNVKPFFNVTSPALIAKLIEMLTIFNTQKSFDNILTSLKSFYEKVKDTKEALIFEKFDKEVYLEDIKASYKNIDAIPSIFNNLAVVSDKHLMDIELPVIARNALDENGKSKNLWYEEIVPKEATFFFVLLKDSEFQKEFDELLERDLVQIGANKSIGYGFCSIKNITKGQQ